MSRDHPLPLRAGDLGSGLDLVRSAVDRRKVFLEPALPSGRTEQLSYGRILEQAARTRSLFTAWGIEAGQRVLIASQNDAAVFTLFLACLESGVCAVLVDPESRRHEARQLLESTRPVIVARDEDLASRWEADDVRSLPIRSAGARSGTLFEKLLVRGGAKPPAAFPDLLSGFEPATDVAAIRDEDLDAYVLFTSGSTAVPRGVRISRRALFRHVQTLTRQLQYDRETVLATVVPMHNADGLIHGSLTAWLNGGRAVRPLRFTLDSVGALLDSVYTHRVSHLVAVPTLLALMERYGAGHEDAFRTDEFEYVITSASPMPEPLWESFEARFGVRIVNVYGLTETVLGGLFCGPDEASYRRGTVGKPVDCECRIVDEDEHDLPDGPGQLLVRGELLLTGYLDGNGAALRGGWFHTGDMATRDADGFYRIVGRKKNIVITGGRNVQPEEVAFVLECLEPVHEAVVLGLEDEVFGEVLVACCVLEQGAPRDPEALIALCRERLVDQKVPRRIVFLPALPRGVSGKVNLPRVRELISEAERGGAREAARGGTDVRARTLALAERTFKIARDQLPLDAGPDLTPGWDSFAHLSFIVGLEQTFGVQLTTASVMRIRTLRDAVEVVEEALASA